MHPLMKSKSIQVCRCWLAQQCNGHRFGGPTQSIHHDVYRRDERTEVEKASSGALHCWASQQWHHTSPSLVADAAIY
jgi:hypothetical protein